MLQIIIIVLVLAADQLSKYLLVPVLETLPGRTLPVIENVFHLTYVKNHGHLLGILQGMRIFFIITTVIVLLIVGYYMIRGRKITAAVFTHLPCAVVRRRARQPV